MSKELKFWTRLRQLKKEVVEAIMETVAPLRAVSSADEDMYPINCKLWQFKDWDHAWEEVQVRGVLLWAPRVYFEHSGGSEGFLGSLENFPLEELLELLGRLEWAQRQEGLPPKPLNWVEELKLLHQRQTEEP